MSVNSRLAGPVQTSANVPRWCCRSCSWGLSWRWRWTDSWAGARWSVSPSLKTDPLALCRSTLGWHPEHGGKTASRRPPQRSSGSSCWTCPAPAASLYRRRLLWSRQEPEPGWRSGTTCTCSRNPQSRCWCSGWRGGLLGSVQNKRSVRIKTSASNLTKSLHEVKIKVGLFLPEAFQQHQAQQWQSYCFVGVLYGSVSYNFVKNDKKDVDDSSHTRGRVLIFCPIAVLVAVPVGFLYAVI